MNIPFLICLVVVVLAFVVIYLSKKDEKKVVGEGEELLKKGNTQEKVDQTYEYQGKQVFANIQQSQRGEEEIDQLRDSKGQSPIDKEKLDKTIKFLDSQFEKEGASEELTKQTSTQRTVTGEEMSEAIKKFTNPQKVEKTLEEKLAFTYYFHSKDFGNAHRYSVAGKFVKVEDKEELKTYSSGYKLVLAYAVVGDTPDKVTGKVDKFSRHKGREIAESFLDDKRKQYEFEVSKEALLTPGRTFGDFAKSKVPLTVLHPQDRHSVRKHYSIFSNWENTGTPTNEQVKELLDYLELIKKAPHRLLVADVEVVQCEFCGGYELEVEGLTLNVDTE